MFGMLSQNFLSESILKYSSILEVFNFRLGVESHNYFENLSRLRGNFNKFSTLELS
jgi:hypothetical protein